MLTKQEFERRCDRLFDQQRARSRPRYWKSGKRAGTVRTPGRELTFDRYDMRAFMAREIGLQAKPCPFCSRPIDILSLELDHVVPLARGGDSGLSNLSPCCEACNREKGELTAEEFRALREFLRELPPPARSDVQKRLRGSSRFLPKYQKKDDQPETLQAPRTTRYRSPQLQLEDPF